MEVFPSFVVVHSTVFSTPSKNTSLGITTRGREQRYGGKDLPVGPEGLQRADGAQLFERVVVASSAIHFVIDKHLLRQHPLPFKDVDSTFTITHSENDLPLRGCMEPLLYSAQHRQEESARQFHSMVQQTEQLKGVYI